MELFLLVLMLDCILHIVDLTSLYLAALSAHLCQDFYLGDF